MMKKEEIRLMYVDLFCGAGGTSTGVEKAMWHGEKCARVVACVNHDPMAIASHAANHPETMHFTEDIRTLNLDPLIRHLDRCRKKYPDALVVLWASLECTNFSKAKGGQPRDGDSRTLAEHLFRYIDAIKPSYIQIENVEEFMSWGDLDEHGHPVSKDKGRCYVKWCNEVISRGYHYDFRLLNAADFGAYTSRKRFFGQFAANGLPINFPMQTYSKNGDDDGGLFQLYKKWKPVREVLDLQDEGVSIFVREKPLCEKTLERIFAGLVKFVAGGKQQYDAWILKYNSMNQDGHHNAPSIDEPCPTVAVQNRLGLVKVQYLSKQFGGDPAGKNISINKPAGTLTTIDHHALVSAKFIDSYYGNGNQHSVDDPCPTIPTKDRFAMITPKFLDMQYGNGTPMSVDAPAGAVTTNPKHILVSPQWLMSTNFNNIGSSLDEPSPTVTANHKWHYLMNPQFQSAGGSVDKPAFTLIARMDKMPPYLITAEGGALGIEVYDTDSPMTVKIKEFMAAYGIIDIKMRMLNIQELKRIMGFPDDYILKGSQADQKKFIGNAVEVNMSRVLCEALCSGLKNERVTA